MRPLRWVILLAAALFLFRVGYVRNHVTVHTDEIHYTEDGLWAKSDIALSDLWGNFVYRHAHPHPFLDPRTDRIFLHGDPQAHFVGDLASYRRAGHPPVYMILLAVAYAPWTRGQLLDGQRPVDIARTVNTLFDVTWLILLFDILRRVLGGRAALGLCGRLALMPFVWVYGTMAYLDALATLMAVLAAWMLLVTIPPRGSFISWALLGIVLGLGVATKQSNIVVYPLLVGLYLLFRPPLPRRAMLLGSATALAVSIVTVATLCHPLALLSEIRSCTDPDLNVELSATRAIRQLSLPLRPASHYYFGRDRHRGSPLVTAPWIVDLYEWTTPLFFVAFAISAGVALFRRRWRMVFLLVILLGFTAVMPLGSVMRRIHLLVPFATLVMGVAWAPRSGPPCLGQSSVASSRPGPPP